MMITVHYLAQLRKAARMPSENIDVSPTCTVARLLSILAERNNAVRPFLIAKAGTLNGSLLVFVGDEQIRSIDDWLLHDGDVVTLLTPMAGG